jgi:orotate phosphoribosyltransferase
MDCKPQAQEDYISRLARLLAASGCLFFAPSLRLKDGRPTPYFINFGNLRTGRLSWELGRCYAHWLMSSPYQAQIDVIVGPSYKGSAIAQATAMALEQDFGWEVAFDYDRKEAKTHGEASGGADWFVTGALFDQARVLVVDDVATSMGTKKEIVDKLRQEARRRGINLELKAVLIAVDRQQTQAVYDSQGRVVPGKKGRDAMADFQSQTGVAVHALCGIRQILASLRQSGQPLLIDGQWRPLDDEQLAQVEEYLSIYGR